MGSSIIEMVIVLVAAAAMTVLGIQQDVAKHRAGVLATEGQNELTIVDDPLGLYGERIVEHHAADDRAVVYRR